MLDERWIRSLHVESMRRADLHAEREPHVLFQASTIGALLDGRLRRRPQLRRAGRARRPRAGDAEPARRRDDRPRRRVLPRRRRRRRPPDPARGEDAVRGGDAVRAEIDERIEGELSHEELLARLDALTPADASSCAIRLDGRFELVRARSVPAQSPPYRPLTEVVADQHVFELEDVAGTMLGFRFPPTSRGSRSPATTSTSSATTAAAAATCSTRACWRACAPGLDPSNDLHVELPPRVDLADPDLAAATHAAVAAVEGG